MSTGMASAVEPDPKKDPWAWAQWARQRDPGTYDHGTVSFSDDPEQVRSNKRLLEQQGLWNPAWNEWANFQQTGGDEGQKTAPATPDFGSLNGYKVGGARGPGHMRYAELIDPTGKSVGVEGYERRSTGWKDYAQAAAIVGAGALGFNAIGGTLGGAAAGGTAASDPLAAYMTTGAVEGSTIGGAAAGGGGAGAVGAGSMASALAAPMELGALPAGGAAPAAAAPAATGSGATTAAGTTSSVGGGAWNGTNFTGTTPLAGSSNLGASAMGIGDWVNLGQLALSAYGVSQASGAASDATNAAAGVAQGQLALSKEALDWAKQIYGEQAPDRKATQDRANAISDAQLEGMQFATGQAKELDSYNKSTFRPLEQRMVSEAAAYDTPERRMAAAASAAADVNMQTAQARKAAERNLSRSGIAPGSAKALAIQEDMATAQGRNVAGAMTSATRNVEGQGYARMADAVGLGRGLAPTQATQQQIATTTGNSSVGNSATGLQAVQSGNQIVPQGFSTAINGNASAGNLFSSVARQQSGEFDQMLGGIAGIGQYMGRLYPASPRP